MSGGSVAVAGTAEPRGGERVLTKTLDGAGTEAGDVFEAGAEGLRWPSEPLVEEAFDRAERRAPERLCDRLPEPAPARPPCLTHGGLWNGDVLADAPRVKAYREHARGGTPAPVLLRWASCLDGWPIPDGPDRAVAALAEGGNPPCVELTRPAGDEERRRTAGEVTEAYRRRTERLPHPVDERGRAAPERRYADTVASLPYDGAPTPTWPLTGGPAAWDDLAARAVLECPRD
ncbi:hypothetical protein [Streptomyces sp. enrichment culture]|uniref:hypothetical protein n=1 Tax=Streptomyces sp. enrichment culture TaxID=1795815 RepID=UPI003F565EB9